MLATRAAPQRGILLMRRSAACNSVSVSEFPSRMSISLTRLERRHQGAPVELSERSEAQLALCRLLEPALRIFPVVERNGLLGELERVLRVEHHRQLFCARGVLARHDRARDAGRAECRADAA